MTDGLSHIDNRKLQRSDELVRHINQGISTPVPVIAYVQLPESLWTANFTQAKGGISKDDGEKMKTEQSAFAAQTYANLVSDGYQVRSSAKLAEGFHRMCIEADGEGLKHLLARPDVHSVRRLERDITGLELSAVDEAVMSQQPKKAME